MSKPLPSHLARGVRVVARGRDHLQVGLLGKPVVVRRTPEAEAALGSLSRGRVPDSTPQVRALLDRLQERGLTGGIEWLDAEVELRGSLGPDAGELLAAYDWQGGQRLGLLLHPGELRRDRVDDWLAAGVPHLVVRAIDGQAVIGPYVVPGVTACLRCLDEYALERDAEATSVQLRYADACEEQPSQLDPALAHLATAWAVRDIVTAASHRRPITWSASAVIGPDLRPGPATAWRRHPACGCGW